MTWRIDWRGSSWSSEDLTGEHVAVIAEMLDMSPSWEWFNMEAMHPAFGPLQLISLIAAFTVVDEQVVGTTARKAVLDSVKGATVDELLASLIL